MIPWECACLDKVTLLFKVAPILFNASSVQLLFNVGKELRNQLETIIVQAFL